MLNNPKIFISAVSKELTSARVLVAQTLDFLGMRSDLQSNFDLEHGQLIEMIKRRIDKCDGVIHLVGKTYGTPFPNDHPPYGEISYTQFEALYARQKNKNVYYLLIEDTFPTDRFDDEESDIAKLQLNYRSRLEPDGRLVHKIPCKCELDRQVLRLRNEFPHFWQKIIDPGFLLYIAPIVVIASWIHFEIQSLDNAREKRMEYIQQKAVNATSKEKIEIEVDPYDGKSTKFRNLNSR